MSPDSISVLAHHYTNHILQTFFRKGTWPMYVTVDNGLGAEVGLTIYGPPTARYDAMPVGLHDLMVYILSHPIQPEDVYIPNLDSMPQRV